MSAREILWVLGVVLYSLAGEGCASHRVEPKAVAAGVALALEVTHPALEAARVACADEDCRAKVLEADLLVEQLQGLLAELEACEAGSSHCLAVVERSLEVAVALEQLVRTLRGGP